MKTTRYASRALPLFLLAACSKDMSTAPIPPASPVPASFSFNSLTVNGKYQGFTYKGVNSSPAIRISFSAALDPASAGAAISLTSREGQSASYATAFDNHDSTVILRPTALQALTQYTLAVSTSLRSASSHSLQAPVSVQLNTAIDSADKFSRISDTALLDLVQRQTFNYFWSFGHPVSGLARERNSSGDVVTTGGSGFGIMAIVAATSRNFVGRSDALQRMRQIVGFLKNAQTFHGAFPHWMNGSSGVVVPFSQQDNGADLVETAYLMEGLLTARQYFNGTAADETSLRNDINALWNAVEWDWFRQNGQNTLYWHWSPDYGWSSGMQVNGWDEALITYVLAASSPLHSIPKVVYDNGWALNGQIKNGNSYFGVRLPLGPAEGGPLFFAHYSFLGINPNGLSDAYASYDLQNQAHTLINFNYCQTNPKGFYGYSSQCWGLSASDIQSGYAASSPTNDLGVITPAAAIASLVYTPVQSMAALRFFYYKLGDRLWGPYGFYDAFDLDSAWFSGTDLAIDEGPIIDMIENYRSGLLWNLFMSCPEVKTGMKNLGFQSPYL